MENIINQIITIDRNAQEKLTIAHEEYERSKAELTDKINHIYSEIEDKTNERIANVIETEKLLTDDNKKEIREVADKQIHLLKEIYNAKHEKLEEEIFNNVIS